MSRDILVYIETATGWMAGVGFPEWAKDFGLLSSVQAGSGAQPASYRVGNGAFPRR
jgi:hypothetical protein